MRRRVKGITLARGSRSRGKRMMSKSRDPGWLFSVFFPAGCRGGAVAARTSANTGQAWRTPEGVEDGWIEIINRPPPSIGGRLVRGDGGNGLRTVPAHHGVGTCTSQHHHSLRKDGWRAARRRAYPCDRCLGHRVRRGEMRTDGDHAVPRRAGPQRSGCIPDFWKGPSGRGSASRRGAKGGRRTGGPRRLRAVACRRDAGLRLFRRPSAQPCGRGGGSGRLCARRESV